MIIEKLQTESNISSASYSQSQCFISYYYLFPGFWLANSELWNCHINSMANQIWIFHIHISKMTSTSQYENNLDAFAPYYYDDENHIDSLTPLIWRRRLPKD
jgi:hypothetical protein